MTEDGRCWHVREPELSANTVTLHSPSRFPCWKEWRDERGRVLELDTEMPNWFTLEPKP